MAEENKNQKENKLEAEAKDKQEGSQDAEKESKKQEVSENKEEAKDKKSDKKAEPAQAEANKKDDNKKKKIGLKPGMTVRIHQKIKELNLKGEEKERIQYFEGIIIAKKHGNEAGGSITIRKISNGVGVEKIFPLNLPSITKIEVKKQAKVKRAKLGFLKRGYKKKLKEKKVNLVEIR